MDWMIKFMNVGKKQEACLKILHDFGNKVIEERRKYHKAHKGLSFDDYVNNIDDTGKESKGPRKRLAMLDLLLAAEDDGLIDDQGIKEEVNTFIAAGYDTTSTALTFILTLLAENQEIQKEARAEAIEVMDLCHGNMSVSDVQNLHYIER
ncbi:probable cytochrome P450 4ac2, partial [Copidosoma floridanum]|uniref:probable cytochrome P450 4ac2 n=1 Tax=Copidosoma floridanum TaxID=29053 RepID=UPI0006C9697D